MFQDKDFKDYISLLTLRFKIQDIEDKFNDYKDKLLNSCGIGKIMVCLITFILSGFFSYSGYMFAKAGNTEALIEVIILTCLSNLAWILEIIIHKICYLQYLASFPFTIIVSIIIARGSILFLPSFAILPG